jgi:threonine dehydratase
MIPIEWVRRAQTYLAPYIEKTPITYDSNLDLFLKWESVQITGSFKVRGALNKVLNLADWELENGLVAASAGNHGLGVAFAGAQKNASVTVFVPENASPIKIQRMQDYAAEVRKVPGGYESAERAGKIHAAAAGSTWVSPYNDGLVIAGQATVAAEILEDIPVALTTNWIVPVGGGGLISGTAAYLHTQASAPKIFGVQAAASPFFHSLFKRNTQSGTQDLPTLCDGLAGAIESDSMTIPLVKKYVQDIILVEEEEIIRAMLYAWEVYGEPMEPSGAVGLAAVLSGKIPGKPASTIISGGNITPEKHLALVKSLTKVK